ncbi:hypothetical protein BGZ94_001050 [Podila epigama]|nr:hypothetical protein BGZ94_001050 [Podila epigama]
MTSHSHLHNQQQQDAILVTGGAGFIGSHTVVQLLSLGLRLVIVDNLCNSSEESLHRALELADNKGELFFHNVDLLDGPALEKVFQLYTFSACIHFAGLKAVGESSQIPLGYYQTNVTGTLNLLQLLQRHNCRNLIFSSSATVYGLPTSDAPINESAPTGALNPYGRTKQYIEEILRDIAASEPNQWNIIMLRYFNPIGAHESGRIGEDPYGTPNNLMPYVAQVAIGRRPVINVFGNDYDTPDGTGVRDYIHVVDLASGHVAALKKIQAHSNGNNNSNNNTSSDSVKTRLGCVPYNLGSGVGYSVMDMIESMSKTVGRPLPYQVVARRPGDVASVVADPSLSSHELNWRATKTLDDMCNDLWRWQTQNPEGYAPPSPTTTAMSVATTSIMPTAVDAESESVTDSDDAVSVASSASSSSLISLPETSPSTPTPGEHSSLPLPTSSSSSSTSSSSSPSTTCAFSPLPITVLPIIAKIEKPAVAKISLDHFKTASSIPATTTKTPEKGPQVVVQGLDLAKSYSPVSSPAPGPTQATF